ncbi:MAG: V/A-type H+/Na+-transporting ATPase subunit [Thermoplasmata archaeon]|jgi:vacuolar-type H+-ATPase subunit E/Vma4|nr:V/A-type H+/Na+-transporting ATPase subunit [Thermoplasmata archaeon]
MGLDQVIGEVRRDGEARAQHILAEARKEAAAILDAARAQAKQHEAARLAAADKEAAAVSAQAASRAESESRKAVLGAEATLRAELKRTILQGLADLPAKTREAHLKKLLARAHAIVPKGTVWGAAQDTAALHAQKTYKHGGSHAIAGGIIVESEAGDARLDLSYETLLDESWRDVLKAEAGLFH